VTGAGLACHPRTIIPEAVFHEFPAKTLRKLAVSDMNPPENARNSMQESGNRIRLSVLTHSCRFRAEADKSGHRIRLREYCFHEISGISQNRPFPCRIVRPGFGKF
jgi:hypothetical protein